MMRVQELMTGERLREISKNHTTFTNSLGDGIFEATYWVEDDELQDEAAGMEEQLMYKHEAVEFLKTADDLGIRVLSAVRSTWRFGDDGRPIYRVRWAVLNPGHEVNPEDLNTGPDTTENINEVVESDDRSTGYPLGRWPKTTAEELEHIDQPPTVLSREWKEQDPETERINKAMARMIWRKVKNLDIRGTIDAMEAHDRGTLEELADEAMESRCPYVASPESDEKIRRASTGFTEEKQTDFPGAAHGEQWLRESEIRDSGDVMFGVDGEDPGERVSPGSRDCLDRMLERDGHAFDMASGPIDGFTECTREETEQCNKNVSQPADYYRYGRILERMDDTHRRKNSDYGDAAYKGYKKFGDYYFMVQLHNKYQRLESLTIGNKSRQVEDESIDDTLLDMANYAVMYLESRHRDD